MSRGENEGFCTDPCAVIEGDARVLVIDDVLQQVEAQPEHKGPLDLTHVNHRVEAVTIIVVVIIIITSPLFPS